MEDVLEVYHRPYDPNRPVVCLDEGGKQLIGESRPPLPVRPGRPHREDYEYERDGVANLFMMFEPLRGWRHVEVTDRKTSRDFAAMNVVYAEFFGDQKPARTTVEAQFASPPMKVEIDCIAYKPK